VLPPWALQEPFLASGGCWHHLASLACGGHPHLLCVCVFSFSASYEDTVVGLKIHQGDPRGDIISRSLVSLYLQRHYFS
jgi:hypothetical protein